MRLACLLLAALALAPTVAPTVARAEGPCEPCALPGGTYHAIAPPGWNGTDRLRLLLFLHGFRGTGTETIRDARITGPAGRLGFLVIGPDGLEGSWGHVGSAHRVRDDVAFLRAVVADAERRWPIDRGAVIAAGFSQGGSMVWDLACYAAPDFTAFLPFSGGFWMPMPDRCASGPVFLRHTHGTEDRVVPMQGRSFLGGKYRQGDIIAGFVRWRDADGCNLRPDMTADEGDLSCESWTRCASGRRLQLCVDPQDHRFFGSWIEASLRWALAAIAAPTSTFSRTASPP